MEIQVKKKKDMYSLCVRVCVCMYVGMADAIFQWRTFHFIQSLKSTKILLYAFLHSMERNE